MFFRRFSSQIFQVAKHFFFSEFNCWLKFGSKTRSGVTQVIAKWEKKGKENGEFDLLMEYYKMK